MDNQADNRQENEPSGILLKNVNIFDGTNAQLQEDMDTLVEGNRIKQIGHDLAAPTGAIEIDGKGHVLMPGIINSHYHMIGALPTKRFFTGPPKDYRAFWYAKGLNMCLMQGVTTVRDIGGNDWGVVHAAEEGLIDAPRIFASGALICQTGGHFDVRPRDMALEKSEFAGGLTVVFDGMAYLADGPDAVRRAARECLRQGATQIKIASGGGAASLVDPIHSIQFTTEEVRAPCRSPKTGTPMSPLTSTPRKRRSATSKTGSCPWNTPTWSTKRRSGAASTKGSGGRRRRSSICTRRRIGTTSSGPNFKSSSTASRTRWPCSKSTMPRSCSAPIALATRIDSAALVSACLCTHKSLFSSTKCDRTCRAAAVPRPRSAPHPRQDRGRRL
ncbi:MAG: amidohydrolase family protein [Anaerolineae bacterium]|nr:amidohydrolase family protein [Anaerolineae bacterium]